MASFFAKPASRARSASQSFCSTVSGTGRRNSLPRATMDHTAGFKTTVPAAQVSPILQQPPHLPPTRLNPPQTNPNPAFHAVPLQNYPESTPTPHPNITIDTVKTAHIPSLMRVQGLLLPVRYPNSFFTDIITDPVTASVSRVAVYHDHPVTCDIPAAISAAAPPLPTSEKVIGGIRCRLEPLSSSPAVANTPPATNLYIQTLHLLSQHRGQGVAASLLNSLIYESIPDGPSPGKFRKSVSSIVRHYNIRSVTAHVQETNDEALCWYAARGFAIQDGIVEGYYRRLKGGNAKIVKLDLQWDHEFATPNENVNYGEHGWNKEIDDQEENDDAARLDSDEGARKRLRCQ